jgi:hypothetical protein
MQVDWGEGRVAKGSMAGWYEGRLIGEHAGRRTDWQESRVTNGKTGNMADRQEG